MILTRKIINYYIPIEILTFWKSSPGELKYSIGCGDFSIYKDNISFDSCVCAGEVDWNGKEEILRVAYFWNKNFYLREHYLKIIRMKAFV